MAIAQSSFIGDFKNFIMKGNVLDLAVAVILGGAFGKIVESLIKDVITPAILSPVLNAAGVKDIEKLVVGDGIKIGLFLSALINFFVIALVIFIMVRSYEAAKKKMARQAAITEPDAALDPVAAAQHELIGALDRLNNTVSQKM